MVLDTMVDTSRSKAISIENFNKSKASKKKSIQGSNEEYSQMQLSKQNSSQKNDVKS